MCQTHIFNRKLRSINSRYTEPGRLQQIIFTAAALVLSMQRQSMTSCTNDGLTIQNSMIPRGYVTQLTSHPNQWSLMTSLVLNRKLINGSVLRGLFGDLSE